MNAVEGFCQRTGEGEILLRDNGGDRSVLQAIPPSGTAPQTVNRTVVDYGAAQGWESCLARLPELSCAVKDEMGSALGIAQVGGNAPTAKTWKGSVLASWRSSRRTTETPIERCTSRRPASGRPR